MDKRKFLKVSGVIAAGSLITPFVGCNSSSTTETPPTTTTPETADSFTLPELAYPFEGLEPSIDRRTMEIHHGKHHAGYVKKLNKAVKDTKFANASLEKIMAGVSASTGDTAVRNNGGGHYNHSLFWSILSPSGGTPPSGDLADAINGTFGSFDKFKDAFSAAAKGVFGSGWAWLCVGADKKMFVTSTPNQDNPLMVNVVEKPGTPILGIDVWEHAYYLNYQNRRGDYIGNFFNVIDWGAVNERLKKIG